MAKRALKLRSSCNIGGFFFLIALLAFFSILVLWPKLHVELNQAKYNHLDPSEEGYSPSSPKLSSEA